MALSVEVLKSVVRHKHKDAWSIMLTMVLSDDAEPVLSRSFTALYKKLPGDADNLAAVQAKLLAEMQEVIDQYKAEVAVMGKPQLDTMVTNIKTALKV